MDGNVREPPTLVEKDHDCQQCGDVHDIEACPRCGADIILGFGIGFGPYGPYKVCEDFCGWSYNDNPPEGVDA